MSDSLLETHPDAGHVARPAAWFVGDLEDPWVVAIADALPTVGLEPPNRRHCPGDLPDAAFGPVGGGTLVIHRAILTRHDAERLRRLRAASIPPLKVVLCHGPLVRYEDLNRWADIVDVALPDATARETVARHARCSAGELAFDSGSIPRPRVAVVSTHFALRRMLIEACEFLGHPVAFGNHWRDVASQSGGPRAWIWDAPVLEPGWSRELSRWSVEARAPILALMGFADRELVSEARQAGAAACLETPVELADLALVLERLCAPAWPGDIGHAVPPPPHVAGVSRKAPASTVAGRAIGP